MLYMCIVYYKGTKFICRNFFPLSIIVFFIKKKKGQKPDLRDGMSQLIIVLLKRFKINFFVQFTFIFVVKSFKFSIAQQNKLTKVSCASIYLHAT